MLNTLINIADATLVNLVSKLGTQRDKASHDQFAYFIPRPVYELNNLYCSDSTTRKIIDRPVQDMFRQGYYFGGIAGKQLQKLNNELKRLNINPHLSKAMRWSRLHGKSYLLLATDDNQPLSMPINTGKGISYITALSVEHLQPTTQKLPASETGGHFNKPAYYKLQKTNDGRSVTGQLIHHSRVIEIVWGDGDGIMQYIYNEVLKFASVNANAASLVHESKIDVIKTPGLARQIEHHSESIIKRFALVGLLKGNNGTVLLDKEEDFISKSYNFTGLPDLMREFGVQTAAAADIPYTVLFGRSPAGLNSTGEHDLKNYYDTVASYQKEYLRPVLEQLLEIICGYLLGDKSVDLVFSPLWQLDEKTRSEVEKNNAERDIKYLEAGILTEAQIAKQLVEEGTYTVIDENHIKMLDSIVNMEPDDAGPTDPITD